MSILVTGGAGYIGSHTCVALIEAGFDVVVVDNLVNSSKESIRRVERITGREIPFYPVDLREEEALDAVFRDYPVDSVIHFAGLKAVGESCEKPLLYYQNNISSTCVLCQTMARHGVFDIVFSSSATVYGEPDKVPIPEDAPVAPFNPYSRIKLMIEEILADLHRADPRWNASLLRYFNPIGAHPSGMIGEDPSDIPNNLMPYICQVAVGHLERLNVFGDDYPTADGTGVRDYIHVMDLAEGHVRALRKMREKQGVKVYNLGTGRGYSVLELVRAMEKASGRNIPYRVTERRPGDISVCYADPSLAEKELGWTASRDLETMCRDAWNWQSRNPQGFGESGSQ